jgi:hypothetical protein
MGEAKTSEIEIAEECGTFTSGTVDSDGGDFVGRDKWVFLGRDTQQPVINVSGDFIGDLTIYPNTTIGRIGAQIDRLRGRVTRLIPAEEALRNLALLREPSAIGENIGVEISVSTLLFLLGRITSRVFAKPFQRRQSNVPESTQKYLSELSEIEAQVAPDMDSEKLSCLLKNLSIIADEVNMKIARLNNLFINLVYPATSSKEMVGNMVSKIRHQELRDEGTMNLGVIERLVEKLDSERLTDTNIDVLGDEAQAAVGVITELEKRRLIVEKLLKTDRRRRNLTVGIVIFYIGVVIALTTIAITQWGERALVGQVALNELGLPLLGIPWPVIVWSLVGSFAAMIHRFNRRPIHDFGDTVKWMLTRPVQGIVLGSALYFVLVSGLFLLTGGSVEDTSSLIVADEFILVLCFLVGFSDRFANSVFNALVERYSKIAKDTGQQ